MFRPSLKIPLFPPFHQLFYFYFASACNVNPKNLFLYRQCLIYRGISITLNCLKMKDRLRSTRYSSDVISLILESVLNLHLLPFLYFPIHNCILLNIRLINHILQCVDVNMNFMFCNKTGGWPQVGSSSRPFDLKINVLLNELKPLSLCHDFEIR